MEWIFRDGKQICSACGYEKILDKTTSGAITLSTECPNCSGAIQYGGNNIVNVRVGVEFRPTKIEGIR